jgi:hypothetical protein
MRRELIALLGLAIISFESAALADEPRSQTGAPWLLDASAGVPKLKSGELRVTGSLLAGYATNAFGAVAWGSGGYYDFKSGNALADWQRAEGYAEGWWVSGTDKNNARLELRASGGVAYYATSYTGTSIIFTDEDSLLGRGSLLVGGRVRSGQALQASILLGGGVQVEEYSSLKVPSAAASQGVSIDDTTKVTFRGEGRLRLRWAMAPTIVALRLHGDGNFFSLRRSDDSIRVMAGSTQTTNSVSTYRQVEAHGRLFVDIDALAFFGISPALFGGLDYSSVSGDGGTVRSLVPIGGLALSKPVW